jgi:uncharacterized membrane protein
MEYAVVKWLHVLSSTVLFGTGIGSAYYMLFASLSGDARTMAHVVKQVVRADWMFTTPTIVLQPLTGFYLIHLAGYPMTLRWIWVSIVLYLLAGVCWLPVVWMQIRMRALAEAAAREGTHLPPLYQRYLRWWVSLGVVAFFALVIVFYLMVAKPA